MGAKAWNIWGGGRGGGGGERQGLECWGRGRGTRLGILGGGGGGGWGGLGEGGGETFSSPPIFKSANPFPCLNANYLLLVTSILCLTTDEYVDRARKDFGL